MKRWLKITGWIVLGCILEVFLFCILTCELEVKTIKSTSLYQSFITRDMIEVEKKTYQMQISDYPFWEQLENWFR